MTLIDENAYRVLESFRPYLGPRGSGMLDLVASLNEMVKSEPGQRMMDSLRSFAGGGQFGTMEVKAGGAFPSNPVSLFLALGLLSLADTPAFEKLFPERSLFDVTGDPEE